MLSGKHPESSLDRAEDLTRLLSAVEAASGDTNLLALNMALEGSSAAAGSALQIAHAVGELSIRATRFSQHMRGCLSTGADSLDPHSLSQLCRVTRGLAELIAEVSDLASDVLDGIADPCIERRLPEVALDLLDQVRSRARVFDQLVHALPDVARGSLTADSTPRTRNDGRTRQI
ncbi:MAG TPA: hypothetical protein VMH26_00195 [Burkholderiales bacterium]|nr:hypothetical protein [Burkholderiales bacterium]